MSPQRCKREHTSREFVRWRIWFSKNIEKDTKEDYRAASIVAEIRRGQVKNPRAVKLEDCLVKVGYEDDKRKGPTSTMSPEQRIAASKAKWLGFAGLQLSKES